METRTEPLLPSDWRPEPATPGVVTCPPRPARARSEGVGGTLPPPGQDARGVPSRRAAIRIGTSFFGCRKAGTPSPGGEESALAASEPRAATCPPAGSGFGGLLGPPGQMTGTLLEGRYLVRERLGQDAQAERYRVRHTRMQKELVLETLPHPAASPEAEDEVSQRVRRASSLGHPALPVVNDAGTLPDGTPYVILDAPPGASLRTFLAEAGRLSPEAALGLVVPLCRAVEHAHAQGVVFARLDPDHLRLRPSPQGGRELQIQRVGPGEAPAGPGAAQGTLGRARRRGPREDVRALGALLYELLTGEAPEPAAEGTFRFRPRLRLPSLRRRLGPGQVSDALEHAVRRALQPHPADRFASAAALRRALEDLPERGAERPPAGTARAEREAEAGELDEVVWPPPRVRARRAVALGALGGAVSAALLCVAAADLVTPPVQASSRQGEASSAPAPRAAPEPALEALRAHLGEGRVRAAAREVAALADRFPADGRVALLAGHLERLRRRPGLALHHYQRALRLSPGLRSAPELLEAVSHLLTLGAEGDEDARHRRQAMALVRRYLGAEAAPLVTRFANTWWEAELVWEGILFLMERGRDQQVDYLYAYELLLRTDRSCYRRLAYLKDIVTRGDPRFLNLLERIAERPGWRSPHTGHWVRNTCIQPEARAAAEALRARPEKAVAARE